MRLQFVLPIRHFLIFDVLFKTEIALLIVNYVVIALAIKVIYRVRVHSNLRLLCVSLLSQYFPSLTARIILILYQMQFIKVKEPAELDIVIVACSLIRTYYFGLILTGILALFAERYLATIYIVDYERRRRIHVAVLLILQNSLYSAVCSYLFVFEVLEWYILALLGLAATVLGGAALHRLYRKNKERRAAVNKDHRKAKHQYTLSLRFQLDENIRAMKMVKAAFMLLGVQNVIYAMLYAAANMELIRTLGDGWVSQLLETLFNFFIATDGVIIAVGALWSEESFLHAARNLKYIGCIFTCWNGDKQETAADETSVYFVTLQSQWDQYFEGGREDVQKTRARQKSNAVRPVNTA